MNRIPTQFYPVCLCTPTPRRKNTVLVPIPPCCANIAKADARVKFDAGFVKIFEDPDVVVQIVRKTDSQWTAVMLDMQLVNVGTIMDFYDASAISTNNAKTYAEPRQYQRKKAFICLASPCIRPRHLFR